MKKVFAVVVMMVAVLLSTTSARAEGLSPLGKSWVAGGIGVITGIGGKVVYDKYTTEPPTPVTPATSVVPASPPAPVTSVSDAGSRIIGKFVDNFWLIVLTIGLLFAIRSRKTVWCWLNKPAPTGNKAAATYTCPKCGIMCSCNSCPICGVAAVATP